MGSYNTVHISFKHCAAYIKQINKIHKTDSDLLNIALPVQVILVWELRTTLWMFLSFVIKLLFFIGSKFADICF